MARSRNEDSLPHERSPGGEFLVDYIYEEPVEQIFSGLVPLQVLWKPKFSASCWNRPRPNTRLAPA